MIADDRPSNELEQPCRPPQQHHDRGRRASLPRRFLWDGLVIGVPLGAGLAVNAGFGWWPGMGAFMIAAVLIGFTAYRADQQQRERSRARRVASSH